MSEQFYKTIHILGVLIVFFSFGRMLQGVLLSGSPEKDGGNASRKKPKLSAAVLHGVGLLLVVLGGFGMIARLKMLWPWPEWVFVKMGIFLALGAAPVLIKRKLLSVSVLSTILFGLGLIAAIFGIFKFSF